MAEPEIVEPPQDKAPKSPAQAKPDKQTRRPGGGRPPGRASATTVRSIEDALTDLFTSTALGFQLAGRDDVAVIFLSRGPKVAKAWAELARQNPAVRRVIEKMMSGGAWGGVIISTVSLAMPLAQAYDVYPSTLPNPFALSLEEIAQVHTMQAQREAFARSAMANGAPSADGDN